MAFWKKQPKDPWDMKPGEVYSSARFSEAPPLTPPPAQPPVENPQGDDDLTTNGLAWSLRQMKGEGEQAEPLPPEPCPWCGQDMEEGYLVGGRDGVTWQNWKPTFWNKRPENSRRYHLLDEEVTWGRTKLVWRCGKCQKMVLNAPAEEIEPFNFKEFWGDWKGGGESHADPNAYDAYKQQWEKET